MILSLARRAVTELERCATAGLDLIATAASRGQDPSAELALLRSGLAESDARLDRLEQALGAQVAGLTALREQVGGLIGQLNERLLPGIDERMEETERDLARLATRLIRVDQQATGRDTRLGSAEQRVTDLRGKVAQLEQRAGLWRDLQANLAKLGDDIDDLRSRLSTSIAEPVSEPLG